MDGRFNQAQPPISPQAGKETRMRLQAISADAYAGSRARRNCSMGAPVARARYRRDDEAPVGRYRRSQTISNGIPGAAGSRSFAPDHQPVQWESRTASNQFRNPSQPLPGTRVARHVPRPCQSRMSSQQGNLGLFPRVTRYGEISKI